MVAPKGSRLSAPALLGIACGLGVSLFFLGYFSGSSKKVPVVLVTGDKTAFENTAAKHERKLSVVRVPTSLKISMEPVDDLVQVTRYKNEKRSLYSVDTNVAGALWSEDIVIGFADGKKGDTPIYLCRGRTKGNLEYSFYSTFDTCWGPTKTGRSAGFTLPRKSPSALHLPLFSCLTPENSRYLSLNSACEDAADSSQEVLGYVRAATVLMDKDDAPSEEPKDEK